MRRITYLALLGFIVFACKTTKNTVNENIKPVSVKVFLEQPFGVNETVASLKKHFYEDVKIRKIVRRNKHDSSKVDSIFQFYHNKSEVFIYKTYFNREMLIGGVIYDFRFPLINGVVPGMKRESFFKAFKDIESNSKDSVKLNSKEMMREFTFIFNAKGELKKIKFSSYID